MEIKSEICEKCRKEYVEEVNEGKLIEGRVDGEREKKAGFLEETRSIGAIGASGAKPQPGELCGGGYRSGQQ